MEFQKLCVLLVTIVLKNYEHQPNTIKMANEG